MPRLLKNDSIRLIEASIEALGLAQTGICTFRRDDLKVDCVRYAAEIGLIGSSIELAMNSILIQAFGKKIILKEDRYKTASEILHDFKGLLKQSSAIINFLTNGILEPEQHIGHILKLAGRFQIIITGRAHGLHNGIGLSYEITASLFQEVSYFLKMIGESVNYRPYLHRIPELVGIHIDKSILIDDLYRQINNSSDLNDQASALSSLFIVLPEVPKNLPEWMSKFESFNIAPKKGDIVYLINALEQANPVVLKKTGESGDIMKVKVVGQNEEGAIPIYSQYLKTEFTHYRDQFYADIANANGRLTSKQLDLPPRQSVYRLFSWGFSQLNLLTESEKLTAHQAWPFIVSAMNTASTGTNAPFWYIIRKTGDLGQLKSMIKKAAKLCNQSLNNHLAVVVNGIAKIEKQEPVSVSESYYQKIIADKDRFDSCLEKFEISYKKNKNHPLEGEHEITVQQVFDGKVSFSILLENVIKDMGVNEACKKYWVGQLTQITPELTDLPILNGILDDANFSNSHTNIRKTMKVVDFYLHGPSIK